MTKTVTEIAPPRSLKGRRARKFWRQLAPIARESGALTSTTEPILLGACIQLAEWSEHPHRIVWNQVTAMRAALKPLGIRL